MLKEHFIALVVKNPPASAWDTRDTSLMPGLGKSHGVGNGNPLQYSFFFNFYFFRLWKYVNTFTGGLDNTEQSYI